MQIRIKTATWKIPTKADRNVVERTASPLKSKPAGTSWGIHELKKHYVTKINNNNNINNSNFRDEKSQPGLV